VETSSEVLRQVKGVVPDVPVFANTGVRLDNVEEQLSIADGAVVGTAFKRDGYTWNEVDFERVRTFMERVRGFRGRLART
jgi:predicted TIM-barrel enzyme